MSRAVRWYGRKDTWTNMIKVTVNFPKFSKASKTAIWPQQGQGAKKREVSAHGTLRYVVGQAVVTANLKISTPWHLIKSYRLLCGNKMPTRCNRGFYCRSYCLLNMFRASLCPSSGAQEYYTVVTACGILCCGFSSSWSGVELRTHNPQLHTRPAT